MIQVGVIIGATLMAVGAMLSIPLMNVALGPSHNTIMNCKEIEMEGYLADECFERKSWRKKDGSSYVEYWLKDRHCKKPRDR